ncbi:MAG TPA: class I SAM-dependent methyltransferase [Tepidisphaeraceae bacterium]|nr:class I SAM-dependent methyltransferase [Tepidisphaeraceae bacterium]
MTPDATTTTITFDDGAAYERYMGHWSRLAGQTFLDWLAAGPGLRWLDVGCGNGAFTGLIFDRCAPAAVHGVDPSAEQIAYARTRFAGRPAAQFEIADAMALPRPAGSVDVAVMPLVIFFVPDPPRGVAEMARVAAPGAHVAAYAWDMTAGGFPYDVLWRTMRDAGLTVPMPPSPDASRLDVLGELWRGADLADVEARRIDVERTFADFDEYWATVLNGPSVGRTLRALDSAQREQMKSTLRAALPADSAGRITCRAWANAVKGRVVARASAS